MEQEIYRDFTFQWEENPRFKTMNQELNERFPDSEHPFSIHDGWALDIVSGWADDNQRFVLEELLDGKCGHGVHSDNQHAWDGADGTGSKARTLEDLKAGARWAIDCVLEKKLLTAPPSHHVNCVNIVTRSKEDIKNLRKFFGLEV